MKTFIKKHFQSIDSTNNWAKTHVGELSKEGLSLISADHQSAGRGRLDRRWISPEGQNIYATFCFFVDESRQDMGHAAQVLALSGAALLEEFGVSPKLKWPNDLILHNKKIGGILCESVIDRDKRCFIAGIGINVNMERAQLDLIDQPATSLFAETGIKNDRALLLNRLNALFEIHLDCFIQEGFAPFFPTFQQLSYFKKGERIVFHDNQKGVTGIFEELMEDGSVRLLLDGGASTLFHAGEFLPKEVAAFHEVT